MLLPLIALFVASYAFQIRFIDGFTLISDRYSGCVGLLDAGHLFVTSDTHRCIKFDRFQLSDNAFKLRDMASQKCLGLPRMHDIRQGDYLLLKACESSVTFEALPSNISQAILLKIVVHKKKPVVVFVDVLGELRAAWTTRRDLRQTHFFFSTVVGR